MTTPHRSPASAQQAAGDNITAQPAPMGGGGLADGVYFNLPAETYFAQDRLGSTDLAVLHSDPADWWFKSSHNPHRPDRETTDDMAFGSALHALLLEGESAYARQVRVRPDTYEDAKTGEEKPWRANAGPCMDWLAENDRPGITIISGDADRRVRHMAELIRRHPELGEPMQSGVSELTVLWTHESGLRLRARFDKLLPRFVVDLKTFGGDTKGATTKEQCLGLVARRHMDVQRYLYTEAREAMTGLIAAGAVHGAERREAEWIERVAAVPDWKWCWIFYRRQDDRKGHAPVVKPIIRGPGDVTHETGKRKVAVALQNYTAFVDRFGFDVPWAVIEATEEPLDHEFPPWIERVNEPFAFPETQKEAA